MQTVPTFSATLGRPFGSMGSHVTEAAASSGLGSWRRSLGLSGGPSAPVRHCALAVMPRDPNPGGRCMPCIYFMKHRCRQLQHKYGEIRAAPLPLEKFCRQHENEKHLETFVHTLDDDQFINWAESPQSRCRQHGNCDLVCCVLMHPGVDGGIADVLYQNLVALPGYYPSTHMRQSVRGLFVVG